MFRRKPKSILELSWTEVFKKIENNEILCVPTHDCLDIYLNNNGLLTVSHPERITEAVSRILDDIRDCCKDFDNDSFPATLKLVGPGCSSHTRVGKFYMFVDPIKKKMIHSFYNRVENTSIVPLDAMPLSDIRSICSFIKSEIKAHGVKNSKEKILAWLKRQIKKDKILSSSDKKIFEDILFDMLEGKSSRLSKGSYRNDMQLRRQVGRLQKDVSVHLKRLVSPVVNGINNFLIKSPSSIKLDYIYDKRSEISARRAKTQNLLERALKVDKGAAEKACRSCGLSYHNTDTINTLLVGVLFIYKDPWIKIELTPLLDLWSSLEEIISKDKDK